QVREQTSECTAALAEVRQEHADAARKTTEAVRAAQDTLNRAGQVRDSHDQVAQQLEDVRRQIAETRSYLERVRQDVQSASQELVAQIEQQRGTSPRRAQEASSDRERQATPPPLPVQGAPSEAVVLDNAADRQDDATLVRAHVRPELPQERLARH